MILLIGGTGETAALAEGLAAAGYEVLVSKATDVPLAVGDHPRISRREGRLGEEGIAALAEEKGIRAIVDAAHPYAAAVHDAAQRAAHRLNIPCLTFRRPALLEQGGGSPTRGVPAEGDTPAAPADGRVPFVPDRDGSISSEGPVSSGEKGGTSPPDAVCFAADHEEAAEMAFSFGSPVLLTTGSRHLVPYAEAARRTGVPYAARVLDTRESREACRAAGIPEGRIIAGRGPFSLEENLAAIRRFEIGVIVTKESGRIGGVDAKLAAARLTHCQVIVIRRPDGSSSGPVFDDPAALIAALKSAVALQKADPSK